MLPDDIVVARCMHMARQSLNIYTSIASAEDCWDPHCGFQTDGDFVDDGNLPGFSVTIPSGGFVTGAVGSQMK